MCRTISAPAARWRCPTRDVDRAANQPAGGAVRACGPDPGLASARAFVVCQRPSRKAALRDDRSSLRPANTVAGPLRAGQLGGEVSPRSCGTACRADFAQGLSPGDQFLFGLSRERPAHPDRTRRLAARARLRAADLVRAGNRFLCFVFGARRARGRFRGQPRDRPPVAASISTARSPMRCRRWSRPG